MRFAVLVLLLVASVSCSPAPDTLRVERVLVGTAIGRFDPFDRTVTDGAAIARVHETVRGFMPAPSGPGEAFCPIAWGLSYRLTFASHGRTTDSLVVDADGCRYAHLSPDDRRWTTESFWAQLAGALGFYTRGSDLFPMPKEMRRP